MLKAILAQIFSLMLISLIYTTLLSKKEKEDLETSIFKVMLIFTFILVCFDILNNVAIYYLIDFPVIIRLTFRIYLAFHILWSSWLFLYIFNINNNKGYKNVSELFYKDTKSFVFFILCALSCIGCFVLKLDINVDNVSMLVKQSGNSITYSIVIATFLVLISDLYVLFNFKKVGKSKKVAILIFSVLGVGAIILEILSANYSVLSNTMAYLMLLIYFTILNPDEKIITELEKDKEEVQELSNAKTNFLSNMSHDIRTPMNAIVGFSESLLMEDITDEQKEEVKNINEAATTLLQIINNVLDISRIESGKETKEEKVYDFKKLMTNLINLTTSRIDSSKVKFNVSIDESIPQFLIGDEIKLYQILMNLLSNASKYTIEGSINFTVTSVINNGIISLKFVVSDTGIGIKESDYDKVYSKFSRFENEENHNKIEGTGLGLAITKSLVDLLGGNISFTSQYHKGTTFEVNLNQLVSDDQGEQDKNYQVASNEYSKGFHFDGSLYDILVVDDNDLNLKVAKRILSDFKFKIHLASSGDECINLLKEGNRYDIIFLDHMMPNKDGIQTFHEIKALENIKIPPIVALTANAMVGTEEMFLKEGFDGYISKPINRGELENLLNTIFCQK